MRKYAEFCEVKVGPQTWDFYLTNISTKVLNFEDFTDTEHSSEDKYFCRVHELIRWVTPKRGRPYKEVVYRVADPKAGEVETAFKSKDEAVHVTFYRRAQLRRGRPPIVRAPRITPAGFDGAIAITKRRNADG